MLNSKRGLSVFLLAVFLFSFSIEYVDQNLDDVIVLTTDAEKDIEKDTFDFEYQFSTDGMQFNLNTIVDNSLTLSEPEHLSSGFLNIVFSPPEV
jgi:hypothetical protein